ncbi:hypothetical protein AVEN_256098-1 [Araneus ventricosus]|uniref:Uncharacterized protein n=1 Tax=Araneus ventricosus TaxID=182803 RepID=A0A4Y2D5M3_ARAVE|nr:hypothetical protein AVEN_256098-1 [Araneus ventricosus]
MKSDLLNRNSHYFQFIRGIAKVSSIHELPSSSPDHLRHQVYEHETLPSFAIPPHLATESAVMSSPTIKQTHSSFRYCVRVLVP